MQFFSRMNPVGGVSDFWHEFRRPTPYRIPILLASFAMTTGLLWYITTDVTYLPPPKPKVILIQTFAPGRTDAEIIASNIANQREKEKAAAEQAEREEAAKEAYRALGRATGLDVDAMERKIAQEKAAEAAAEKARLKQLTGGSAAETPIADQPN